MEKDCETWRIWAQTLQYWGIAGWAATLLEAAGPLTILMAQAVYLGQPLLGRLNSDGCLETLARALEDPQQAKSLAHYLREASSP